MVNNEFETMRNEDLAAECAKRPVNEQAWQEFWRRFYPLVYKKVVFFLRPLGDAQELANIDDVIQAIFVRLFTSLPKYDPQRSPLSAYIQLVGTHCILDYFRSRRAKRVAAVEELALYPDAVCSDLSGEAEELWSAVIKVLELLEPRNQRIVEAFLKTDDRGGVCRRFGITRSHLYTITYRFRKSLRNSLAKKRGPLSDSYLLRRI